jgi:hypothetical protein
VAPARPELAGLSVADPPERWQALGFAVGRAARFAVGAIEVRLGGAGTGITRWTVRGIAPGLTELDGLATDPAAGAAAPTAVEHPNGVIAIDHVVVLTPDFDRTAAALDRLGMPLRRVRDAGSFRQGFRRLGPAILELVEAVDQPPGPARFWGLVAIAPDLEALRERLHPHLGPVRPAVQRGRHIATLAASAGLSTAVAFMDPEPARDPEPPGRP